VSSTQIIPQPGTPRRRNVELMLIVFAAGIATAAYINVGLGRSGTIPGGAFGYGVAILVLGVLAHLVVRYRAPYADPLLLPSCVLLNGIGIVLIGRLDLAYADRARQFGREIPSSTAPNQVVWSLLGVLLFITVLIVVRDHRVLQRYTYIAMLVGIALLLLPVLPIIGAEINGARIWIRVAGFSFQPGELAKLVLLVFFAGYLVVKRDVLSLASRHVAGIDFPRGRDLGPIVVAWAASMVVLVMERDLGTALLFFGIFVSMLYIATQRTSWLLIGLALFVGGAYVAYALFSHVQSRITIWIDPFSDPGNSAYQIVQSLYGFATGGILGTGLGQGRPETVPFAKSDFIMAAVGEELGLTGFFAILLLYAIIIQRGFRTAVAVRDGFGKLLAAGLAASLAIQVFVVVGGVIQLLPVTGLTTPFLAAGGSSLIASWMLIALLMRISDAARAPAPAPSVATSDAETQVVKL
jgi:cell division protein FtsW (lipid II flippase)